MAKRILFVEGNVDGTIGGSYFVLLDLVRHLDRTRFEPVVVFHKDNRLIPEFRAMGVEALVVPPPEPIVPGQGLLGKLGPLRKAGNLYTTFVGPARRYARLMRDLSVDLLNLNNSIMRNHAWMLAAEMIGLPYITHEMGINQRYTRTARFFAKRMPRILCVSEAIQKHMKGKGLDLASLRVVANGLDATRYRVERSADDIRSQWGIRDDEPLAGVVGNIKSWKGQHVLIEAAALLKARGIPVKVMLVGDCAPGDAAYKDRLESLIQSKGLKESVIFTGFQSNPIDYMNAMDVVVHTSVAPEPFGIVLLEAMWLSKPLISTAIGGPLEIVVQGESGILVEPDDPAALADAVADLLSDPAKAAAMGANGKERLEDHFTVERMVNQTMSQYAEVLGE